MMETDNNDNTKRLPGVYVAVKFKENHSKFLSQFFIDVGIKNLIPSNELHVTLSYAEGINYFPKPQIFRSIIGLPVTFFNPEYKAFGENQDTLVLAFDSPFLTNECKILQSLGLIHSYKDFQPHLSLSYEYNNDPTLKKLNWNNQLPFYKRSFDIGELVWEPINTDL